jgi:SAM-dependent methyltransferase
LRYDPVRMSGTTVDSKAAEKAYLARSGSEAWERAKPFSPPAQDMLGEGLALIHDFSVAIGCLNLQPGDRVLDLAAGSCWVSEWLTRFNVRTVSVDLARDMLAIGRDRLPPGAAIVAGDLEQLPFRDACFPKAVCLNAFHHLPDRPAGLREIRRVLEPGGQVVFSEPGRGHADAATSTRAIEEFGVTEREILAEAFLAECRDAGFSDVRIKPVAYAIPWFDLDAARFAAWGRLARSRRPIRALGKIWRACLEVVGLGKDGVLVEEALLRDFARLTRDAMEDHPVVVATR